VAVSELLNSTSGGRIYPQRTSGLTRPVANAKKENPNDPRRICLTLPDWTLAVKSLPGPARARRESEREALG
jgi:hypothetical protein